MGDYASTSLIFLTPFFFVVAFAAYKFGQFPASQVPLAYFLAGLSTISVTTYGVADSCISVFAWSNEECEKCIQRADITLHLIFGHARDRLIEIVKLGMHNPVVQGLKTDSQK